MKKGFTLIELLIVMVLVGVLVTVALPKYYSSMERGRAMEGINNLRAASEAVNASYIMNDNTYVRTSFDGAGGLRGDFTKAVSFTAPGVYAASANEVSILVRRTGGDVYDLVAYNKDGELKYIECKGTDSAQICENVGFEKSGSTYKMDFTK